MSDEIIGLMEKRKKLKNDEKRYKKLQKQI